MGPVQKCSGEIWIHTPSVLVEDMHTTWEFQGRWRPWQPKSSLRRCLTPRQASDDSAQLPYGRWQ